MTDVTGNLMLDTAHRLMGDLCDARILLQAETGHWPGALWDAIEGAGLPAALVPEDAGGVGAPAHEALALLRAAGEHALPLPLAETMLAGWLLAAAGLAIPPGPLTVAAGNATDLGLKREGRGWRIAGVAARVPWARHAGSIVTLSESNGASRVAIVPGEGLEIAHGENIAREPRDGVRFDCLLADNALGSTTINQRDVVAVGAAMRSEQMAGALARVTAMTVAYAQERVQFGRPIGKFQAIQQSLAVLAGHAAAARAAADMAAEAVAGHIRMAPIACAKVRCGEAASVAPAIAHQVHGALGFTAEHRLHFFTKRLWSWREEYGNEIEWSIWLGRHTTAGGPDRFWARLTEI